MEAVDHFIRKLSRLLRREKFYRELDEEMAFHRALTEKEFQVEGMSMEDARHAARRQFGNDLRLKEQSHEVVSFRLESIWQDLRFAIRQMLKNSGFAGTAILILALGICANVAIFGFVDAALIQPLPFHKSGQLVALYESISVGPRFHLSYPDYLDWKSQNTVFSALEAYEGTSFSLETRDGAQHAAGAVVSDGFFRLLGVVPSLGRDFHSGEDQPSAQRVVILSYAAWLVGGFAALALLLGVVGLYGVIAYSVSQRTREIGVRMALGAQRGSVYRLILREAGLLAVMGISAGLALSIMSATLMRKFLFEVQAWDAPTLVAVAVVLGTCALLASYLPARRAASVNPVEALRAE